MPRLRLEDSREIFNDAGEVIQKSARSLWEGFSDFALQENVVGVAVGLMYVRQDSNMEYCLPIILSRG
jgi:large conductance mechanosensitive channel